MTALRERESHVLLVNEGKLSQKGICTVGRNEEIFQILCKVSGAFAGTCNGAARAGIACVPDQRHQSVPEFTHTYNYFLNL